MHVAMIIDDERYAVAPAQCQQLSSLCGAQFSVGVLVTILDERGATVEAGFD